MNEPLSVRREFLAREIMPGLGDPIRESPTLEASLPDLIQAVKAQGAECPPPWPSHLDRRLLLTESLIYLLRNPKSIRLPAARSLEGEEVSDLAASSIGCCLLRGAANSRVPRRNSQISCSIAGKKRGRAFLMAICVVEVLTAANRFRLGPKRNR
jgi:hypothetical protein